MSEELIHDFKSEAQSLRKEELWGRDKIVIRGGRCPENRLDDVLRAWDLPRDDVPWCIWEHTDRIVIRRLRGRPSHRFLERGRVFGPGGDLAFRRDGERGEAFLWRFLGPLTAAVPASPSFAGRDFWEGKNNLHFRRREGRALLWGSRAPGGLGWMDTRVARARLHYPVAPTASGPQRVSVRYATFGRGGRIEFVWLQELEGCQ